MKERYYFAIRYLPDLVDEGLLAGRCIKVLHGVLSSEFNDIEGGIGVSFPQWSQESIGYSIAFVSESSSYLEFLSKQNYFMNMKSESLFDVSEIKLVPEGLSEVRFRRNQSIAKCFAGEKRRRLERAKRRAKARGEEFLPHQADIGRELEHFHRAYMTSKSKGTKYLLHIQKDTNISQRSSQYSQYGLATNEELDGTVPDLSV